MTADNDSDWVDIDLSSPAPSLEIETEEGVEIETKPEVQVEAELPSENKEEPELEGIETKGAEKRIRQLIKQRKERDEQLHQQQEEINQLRNQMSEAGKIKFDYDGALADAKEGEVQASLESARNKFKEAYDSGNRENVLAAQEEVADARAELKLLDQRKQWIKQQQEEYSSVQEQQVQQRESQQKAPYIDPLAKDWAESNDWFGKDRTATAVALSIDAELKEKGEDPSDPAFYEKVDIRLKEELPNKFGDSESSEEATPKKPKQVVAGRSHSPASKNKVKLTNEDVRLAKKWSIPLDRYAAEKAKAERSDGDYTTVV